MRIFKKATEVVLNRSSSARFCLVGLEIGPHIWRWSTWDCNVFHISFKAISSNVSKSVHTRDNFWKNSSGQFKTRALEVTKPMYPRPIPTQRQTNGLMVLCQNSVVHLFNTMDNTPSNHLNVHALLSMIQCKLKCTAAPSYDRLHSRGINTLHS